ncbi:unnamed protein product [Paramecium pentaurelia]|uniref:Uncharacterized protein n=1 Tax=Paramecium pentaurelia TaxID=43138 RepID=A0A8S1S799_9CILI|nr:unnamed protein product [Paramecium pentaurelia]
MSKIEQRFLETGFSRIDELIDSLVHIPFTYKTNYAESHLQIPQINQFNISEFNYSSQMVGSVTPLVKQIIKEEIEIVQQNLIQINIQKKYFIRRKK